MRDIADCPLPTRINVTEDAAGDRNARLYIKDVGLERAIGYFNAKARYLTRHLPDSRLSYWRAYHDTLVEIQDEQYQYQEED